MKAIMLSTQPKWVAEISNGTKTIEIRKTEPKCDLPIDVYIYCTKDRKQALIKNNVNGTYHLDTCYWDGYESNLNGKVVGKFTLEKISLVVMQKGVDDGYGNNGFLGYALCGNCFDLRVEEKACLTKDELFKYLNGIKRPLIIPKDYKCKRGYAWHISNLVIFDKPKELKNFLINSHTVSGIGFKGEEKQFKILKPLKRAPESYCYIEID